MVIFDFLIDIFRNPEILIATIVSLALAGVIAYFLRESKSTGLKIFLIILSVLFIVLGQVAVETGKIGAEIIGALTQTVGCVIFLGAIVGWIMGTVKRKKA